MANSSDTGGSREVGAAVAKIAPSYTEVMVPEDVADVIADLMTVDRTDLGDATVLVGRHPLRGWVTVVTTAGGAASVTAVISNENDRRDSGELFAKTGLSIVK